MGDLEQKFSLKQIFLINFLQKLAHFKTVQSHPGVFKVTYVDGNYPNKGGTKESATPLQTVQ